MKLKVIRPFKDKTTAELYQAGVEIESADIDRINDIVARGLCIIVELGEVTATAQESKISLFDKEFDREVINTALKLVKVKGNIAAFGDATVIAKIAELSEEQLRIFKDALLAE